MKKIKMLVALVLGAVLLQSSAVYAAGGILVSTGSMALTTGGATTFTITANNATGRVDISTSNPAVAAISSTSEFLDNSSVQITVTAGEAGNARIMVTATDVTTYDNEDVSGVVYNVNVVVSNPSVNSSPNPPAPSPNPPAPNPNPSPSPAPNPAPTPSPDPAPEAGNTDDAGKDDGEDNTVIEEEFEEEDVLAIPDSGQMDVNSSETIGETDSKKDVSLNMIIIAILIGVAVTAFALAVVFLVMIVKARKSKKGENGVLDKISEVTDTISDVVDTVN